MTSFRVRVAMIACFIAGGASAEEVTVEPGECREALEMHRAYCESLSPFDLRGSAIVTDEFRDSVTEADFWEFRMQFDFEKQFVRFVINQELPQDSESRPGIQSKLFGVLVDGSRVSQHVSNAAKPIVRETDSFREAVEMSMTFDVRNWGPLDFPTNGEPEKEWRWLTEILFNEATMVTATSTAESIVYSARKEYLDSEGKFDVLSWRFRMPDMVVAATRLQRAVNGKATTYYDLELDWKDVDGVLLCQSLVSNRGRLLRIESPRRVFGRRKTVADLTWNTIRETFDKEAYQVKDPFADLPNFLPVASESTAEPGNN